MLDDLVLETLARLEAEYAAERRAGLPAMQRSRQVAPTTGRFLFALAAAQAGIEVVEIGGSRGYSSIWLAAGARVLGGRLVSLECDPAKCEAWRANVAAARLEEWAELVEGDAHETLARAEDTFDLVFLDAEKEDYEALFALARPLLEPGGLVVADNVLSHAETLGAYSAARQADPTLSSVTVPLDSGLELSVVLRSDRPH
jgi:caffeoyl-CoA O-methyltransferase